MVGGIFLGWVPWGWLGGWVVFGLVRWLLVGLVGATDGLG